MLPRPHRQPALRPDPQQGRKKRWRQRPNPPTGRGTRRRPRIPPGAPPPAPRSRRMPGGTWRPMTRAMTLWRALRQPPLHRDQPDQEGVMVLIGLTPDIKFVFLERPRHRAQTAH